MSRKTEQGTRLPKVGTDTTTAPVVPHPTPEERGNVQFATVQPGSVRVGGPGLVSGWSGVRFPVADRVRLGGDLLDVSGLYLTSDRVTGGKVSTTRTGEGVKVKGEGVKTPRTGQPREGGQSLDGFSVSSVIRWCGSQGFTASPVLRAILTGWGVECNPLTVSTQVQHGRKGTMSVPDLPPEMQSKLRGLIADATK